MKSEKSWGDRTLSHLPCASIEHITEVIDAYQDLTRSTRFFHVKQFFISFGSYLNTGSLQFFVQVQNGFPVS